MSQLRRLVDVWRSAAADFSAVARQVGDADWTTPTDCPGWSVRDVVAHAAALESELAGGGRAELDPTEGLDNAKTLIAEYAEQGVRIRRGRSPAELIAEFDTAVERRSVLLDGEALDDPASEPPLTPGGIGWDWATLLRNRPLDLWVHEQDIRRAIGKPGGLDSVAAEHAQAVFVAALPMIVAKRAAAPAGSTVIFDITGPVTAIHSVSVDSDGRGSLGESTGEPDVQITLDTESFTILGAGRREASVLPLTVEGNLALADRVLAAMPVTP